MVPVTAQWTTKCEELAETPEDHPSDLTVFGRWWYAMENIRQSADSMKCSCFITPQPPIAKQCHV